jgi:hypothetical protein
MVVMCGHEMFILREAKTMQTEEEIRDFRGGRRIKFFRSMKPRQQASNLTIHYNSRLFLSTLHPSKQVSMSDFIRKGPLLRSC